MSQFQDVSEQICKILKKLSNEQRMVMFGDTDRFEIWLASHQVIDFVSSYNPFKLVIIILLSKKKLNKAHHQFSNLRNQCRDAERRLVQFLSYRSILQKIWIS
jgi:hypothetical protein